MKKSLYVLPAVLLFGVTTAGAQIGKDTEKEQRNRPETSKPQEPMGSSSQKQSKSSAKNGPELTTASAVASGKDDQKVRLKGKIVGKQGGNEYMFRDDSGQVLVEIGSRAVKGSNKQLTAGTEVEIQGEVDTRSKGKAPKVEAKQVTIVAAGAGGMSSGSSGSSSAPQRSQSPSSGSKY
jgi:uncharacterized protein (TIGR00156 family)